MRTTEAKGPAFCGGLLLTVLSLGVTCLAQSQGPAARPTGAAPASARQAGPDAAPPAESASARSAGNAQTNAEEFTESRLGLSLLKNIALDQKTIWTSPAHLRWADGAWLFPLTAVTAGFFATDRAIPPALSANPKTLSRYSNFSNDGVYALVGAGGGLYLWGKVSHDDHERETGILAGEAAIDSLGVDTAFKYVLGRERPAQGAGLGNFFQRGDSFPSDHSAIAWSIASVIAHEYPGPLTKIAVYGLATAVSASRVAGARHFPSDVVVGGAIGWLIGRQIFRAHHDPELGGEASGGLSGSEEGEEQRDRHSMGSPSVPLDSWVYPSFERLAALRAINTQIMGLKPWTRMECARLTQEAGETLQEGQIQNAEEAARIQTQLAKEFSYELTLLDGRRNRTASLESVYARAVSISGPALSDGYHFGQTISDDFGRPFERGASGQAGASFRAAAGPLALYVRAEYQHAPGAPALPLSARNAISIADSVSSARVPSGPVPPIDRLQLLDAYVGVNLDNWQLLLGKQSLSWTPGPGGSMLWSDNIDPVNMVRLANSEPVVLPSLLRYFGPVRIDQFFGRLEGHPYVPRPFEYGQKISMKPLPFLELGFARTVTIGGRGSGQPLTSRLLFQSFFGLHNNQFDSVPGDSHSEMDWLFYVPGVRNYVVLYGDAYADDDILPIKNPPKNPWRPGIYVTRFPRLANLDLHVEWVSTEQPGASFNAGYTGGPANRGQFNYWNSAYPDGYTNGGNLIGNSVGRDGKAVQGWLTYWLSPRDSLQAFYKNSSVAGEFMPGGGAWQDYSVRSEVHLRSGFYLKTELQYEHISRYPVLYPGPQRNVTAILEVGFSPGERGRK
ncbi:MAG: capsule assembly Wzi family protein [Candidatus Acidiferrales bacterium]